MDDAYLNDVTERARALIADLMPPRLYGPRSAEEWNAIEAAIEAGFTAGGLRAHPDLRAQHARLLCNLARHARGLREVD